MKDQLVLNWSSAASVPKYKNKPKHMQMCENCGGGVKGADPRWQPVKGLLLSRRSFLSSREKTKKLLWDFNPACETFQCIQSHFNKGLNTMGIQRHSLLFLFIFN